MIIRPVETNPFYHNILLFIFPGKSSGGLKSEEYDPAEPTEDNQVSVRNVQFPSPSAVNLICIVQQWYKNPFVDVK